MNGFSWLMLLQLRHASVDRLTTYAKHTVKTPNAQGFCRALPQSKASGGKVLAINLVQKSALILLIRRVVQYYGLSGQCNRAAVKNISADHSHS